MRKITEESTYAFEVGDKFKKSNMEVDVVTMDRNVSRYALEFKEGDVVSKLYLHGNMIAVKNFRTGDISISNAGWTSNTTKERLNGITGVSIYQRNWSWYLHDKEWDGSWVMPRDYSLRADRREYLSEINN